MTVFHEIVFMTIASIKINLTERNTYGPKVIMNGNANKNDDNILTFFMVMVMAHYKHNFPHDKINFLFHSRKEGRLVFSLQI